MTVFKVRIVESSGFEFWKALHSGLNFDVCKPVMNLVDIRQQDASVFQSRHRAVEEYWNSAIEEWMSRGMEALSNNFRP